MIDASKHSRKYGRTDTPGPPIPIFSTPILACAYALIIAPLLLFFTHEPSSVAGQFETRNEHKFFWPTLTAVAAIVAMRKLSRGSKVSCPPHIFCLIACVAFAGITVLWA